MEVSFRSLLSFLEIPSALATAGFLKPIPKPLSFNLPQVYKACARAYRRSEILKRLNLCHHREHKVWRPCWTTAQRGPRNHQCLTCMRFTNQMGRCPRNHTSQLGGEKMIIVVLIRWTDSHEKQRRETGQFLKPFSFFQVGQPF